MKNKIRENFRVVVEPNITTWYGRCNEEDLQNACDSIKTEIERHVDDIMNVEIQWDSRKICSFCGYDWEEDESSGEPLCCQAAIDEFLKKADIIIGG